MKNITLADLIREGKITTKTLDRVNIAKSYLEKKYSIKKEKDTEIQKGKKNKKKLKKKQIFLKKK